MRRGTAHVRIDDTDVVRLTADQGAWIPAHGWTHRAVITDPGTVAFPLRPHAGAGSLSELTPFDVPAGWQDWLIQHFNLQNTPFSGRGYAQNAIAAALRQSGSLPGTPVRRGNGDSSASLASPEMPRAPGARAAAEELIRDPGLDLTVEQWAARVFSSPRTLRRDFLADTGLTFEQWRLRHRLIAAVEFMAGGYDVDQTVARVGFVSRNGFTRAFKDHYGLTPHAFSRMLASSRATVDVPQRAAAARQADDLVRMVRGDGAFTAAPDPLPATSTPSHTNNMHVLSWVYRGSGYLDIGDRRYERERGVATWIPAGMEHITGLREDSVSLPLGDAGTGDLRLTEPLQVGFSPAWDDYLMFCSISARSVLHSDEYDPGHILELFAEQVAVQRSLTVMMPSEPRARAAAMDYLRRIDTADASRAFDVPTDVDQAFRNETGMAFARWRYAARMRVARDLLAGGARASTVASRLGYRHLPSFSVAFSRFHGASPREFQERET